MVIGGTGSVYRGTLWYSVGRYWLVFDGIGYVWGGTGWYLAILGQYRVVYRLIFLMVLDGMGPLCLYMMKK